MQRPTMEDGSRLGDLAFADPERFAPSVDIDEAENSKAISNETTETKSGADAMENIQRPRNKEPMEDADKD